MKPPQYKSYDELPLFLNANQAAQMNRRRFPTPIRSPAPPGAWGADWATFEGRKKKPEKALTLFCDRAVSGIGADAKSVGKRNYPGQLRYWI